MLTLCSDNEPAWRGADQLRLWHAAYKATWSVQNLVFICICRHTNVPPAKCMCGSYLCQQSIYNSIMNAKSRNNERWLNSAVIHKTQQHVRHSQLINNECNKAGITNVSHKFVYRLFKSHIQNIVMIRVTQWDTANMNRAQLNAKNTWIQALFDHLGHILCDCMPSLQRECHLLHAGYHIKLYQVLWENHYWTWWNTF